MGRPKTTRTPDEQVAHAELTRQVMALHVAGANFEQIGEALGKNRGTIFKIWREGLRTSFKADAEEELAKFDMRTEAAVRTAYGVMTEPKSTPLTRIKAAVALVNIEAKRASVLGFAKPTRTEVTGANGAPIAVTASAAPTPADAARVMRELFGGVTPDAKADDDAVDEDPDVHAGGSGPARASSAP